MRIIAILIISISCSFSVEWTEADLPEDSSKDFGEYIIAQQKVLDEAQADMVKLRDRLVKSLESDLRKYERKGNDKAVAAIKALIEAQNEMISVVKAGQEVVRSGIPTDPSVPETIFDTSTIEERKARLAAQREWEKVSISGHALFYIAAGTAQLIDPSEGNIPKDGVKFNFDINELNKNGPVINSNELFQMLFPKSYNNGVRITGITVFHFMINGKSPNKRYSYNGQCQHLFITVEDGRVNLLDVIK